MYRLVIVFVLFLTGCAKNPVNHDEHDLDLSEGISKAYGQPLLQSYQSCEQLKNDLKDTAMREMHARMAMLREHIPNENYFWPGGNIRFPPALSPTPASAEAGSIGGPGALVEGIDFSGTNNQEKNVDEADIIKIDGNYFYILRDNKLDILAIGDNGGLTEKSSLLLPDQASSLLIMGDKALVFTNNPLLSNLGNNELTDRYFGDMIGIMLVDLSRDRSSPQILDTKYFQGALIAARTIGDSFYVSTYYDAGIPDIRLNLHPSEDFYTVSEEEQRMLWDQMITRLTIYNERIINEMDFLSLLPTELTISEPAVLSRNLSESDCAQSFGANNGSETGFTNLLTITPNEQEINYSSQWVKGNRPIVYASLDQIVVASPDHKPWWFFNNKDQIEETSIHRFKIGDNALLYYADSVKIDGTIKDSFSVSEYEGYLRIATTVSDNRRFFASNDSPRREEQNNLYILGQENGSFGVVSSIKDLAPGERIWSARFSKDKGFIVTFKQIDPLFTIDLRDPKNPKVAGVLKVPGVSTYLQDIGDDQVLSVGYGGNEDGLDFNTTVSLFDVSDFNNPALAKKLSFAIKDGLNDSWSNVWSEGNNNHLAINYFSPKKMTAIPLSTSRWMPEKGYEYISILKLINTDKLGELSVYGDIDHSKFYKEENYYMNTNIRRSYFVGDYIYAISAKAITATRLSDLSAVSDIVLQ